VHEAIRGPFSAPKTKKIPGQPTGEAEKTPMQSIGVFYW
jgi:hypothetical protein